MTDGRLMDDPPPADLRRMLTVGRLIRSRAIREIEAIAWQYNLTCTIREVKGFLDSDLYIRLQGASLDCIKANAVLERLVVALA